MISWTSGSLSQGLGQVIPKAWELSVPSLGIVLSHRLGQQILLWLRLGCEDGHNSSVWNFIGMFFTKIFNGCRDFVIMTHDKIHLATGQE